MTSASEAGRCIQDDGWVAFLVVIAVLLGVVTMVLAFRATLAELNCHEYVDKYARMLRVRDLAVVRLSESENEAARLRKELEKLMALWPVPRDAFPLVTGSDIQHNPKTVGNDNSGSNQDNGRVTTELPTDTNQSACPNTHTPAHDLAKDDNECLHHLPSPSKMPHQSLDRGDGRPSRYRTLDDELRAAMAEEGDEAYESESEAEARYWGNALAAMDFGGPISPLLLPPPLQSNEVMEAESRKGGIEGSGLSKDYSGTPGSDRRKLC